MGAKTGQRCGSHRVLASFQGAQRLPPRGAPRLAEMARPQNPTMLCHWLGGTQENHGLNSNAAANPQNSAAGGHQLVALLVTSGKSSLEGSSKSTVPQRPHWS